MLNMFSAYLSKKFRLGMLGDALLYGFVYAVILLGRIKNIDLGGVLPVQSVQYYFPFFVMGLLMRKYQFLNGMVLNKYSYAVGMLLLIIGWYFSFIESFVIWFVAALGAVVVVWMACREINSDLKVARILSIVGMNTLPIYAIHYLFIGVLPNTLHEMVYISNGFFFQLVVSFVYAVFAIILCLLVDRILSLNPITRMLFWGEVLEVNAELEDTPELVNEDAYGKGWLIKISLTDASELEELLSAEDYQKLIAK